MYNSAEDKITKLMQLFRSGSFLPIHKQTRS